MQRDRGERQMDRSLPSADSLPKFGKHLPEPGLSQAPGSICSSAMWVAGSRLLWPSLATSNSEHEQAAGTGTESALEPRHSNVGCKFLD